MRYVVAMLMAWAVTMLIVWALGLFVTVPLYVVFLIGAVLSSIAVQREMGAARFRRMVADHGRQMSAIRRAKGE
jgi:ABC-type uncharacterized transport system fused permease/ATPase subunit